MLEDHRIALRKRPMRAEKHLVLCAFDTDFQQRDPSACPSFGRRIIKREG
jgi:hypothetical protein